MNQNPFNWDTDWETYEGIPWQDPEVAEMFYMALRERQLSWAVPAPMSNLDSNSFARDVPSFWLELINQAYQLATITYTQFDIDGVKPETWWEKYGWVKWPPPNGFRRIFPHTINTLQQPGMNDWVARYEWLLGISPTSERKYSGRRFQYLNNKWNEVITLPTVLKATGKPRIGDYLGGHTLNDLKECVNLAVNYGAAQVLFSSNLEKNAKFGYGWQNLFSSMNNTEIAESLEFAKQMAQDDYNDLISTDYSDSEDINVGESGWSIGNLDKSLKVFKLSKENRHGIARLERVGPDSVRFWGCDSTSPSETVKLKVFPPEFDIINNPDNATKITDGEGKSIWVLRTWEPFSQSNNLFEILDINMDATLTPLIGGYTASGIAVVGKESDDNNPNTTESPGTTYSGSTVKKQFNEDGSDYTWVSDYVKLSGTGVIGFDPKIQPQPKDPSITLGSVRRKSVGEIREDSTFICRFDNMRPIFYSPKIQGAFTGVIDTSTPSTFNSVATHAGSFTLPTPGLVIAWSAILFRMFAYPYIRGMNGDANRTVKRRVLFFTVMPLKTTVEFDDYNDPIPEPESGVYKKIGDLVESDWIEIKGPKLGNLGEAPQPWATTGVQTDSTPVGSSRGYINVRCFAMVNYDFEGGFKYRKGYTGR